MTTFYEAMNNELKTTKSVTTNGALAYETAGKEILDFNFGLTAMRRMSEQEIKKLFSKVFYEDKLTAIKYLFYVGDVREGIGERKIFRACFDYLAEEHPVIAQALLDQIPEYTRWDNLVRLIDHELLKDDVTTIIKTQLVNDLVGFSTGKTCSLLAKWLPSENATSNSTKLLAKKVRKAIGMDSKTYRKTLSILRKYIDVVEVKMSAKKWDEIKYENVPSKANLNYNSAFLKNDETRRRAYLESLAKGETKINASVLTPDEIVRKYSERLIRYDETLEQLWKNLKDVTCGNTLVIRDGSGSMYGKPLDVATALAIYMSEHTNGGWKNKFITFSARPKVVDLSNCKNLKEKLEVSYRERDMSNTNLKATMLLILRTAIVNHMTQDEMPERILIISDMQFDGRCHNLNESLMDSIKREYDRYGYKLPRICFWNVDEVLSRTVPMQQNELGLVLLSGYSVNLLNMVMTGELDPYKALLEQINAPRYEVIEELVKALFRPLSGPLAQMVRSSCLINRRS